MRAIMTSDEAAPRLGVRRAFDIIRVLATSDLQVRYGRGGLRALKWFLEPYATVGIFLILISSVLNTGTDAPGLTIACAIVPLQLVTATFGNGLQAVGIRSTIIVNMAFPRMLLPPAALATETISFLASFTLLPLMMLVYWVAPTWAILWLPVMLVLTAAFALSLAYPAALFGLWYPEYQSFVHSVVRTMFFLAPGLVALSQIEGTIRKLMPYNPFTGLFEGFRNALLYGHTPPAWEILVPLGFTLVFFAGGITLFRREERYLAKLVG